MNVRPIIVLLLFMGASGFFGGQIVTCSGVSLIPPIKGTDCKTIPVTDSRGNITGHGTVCTFN
jgi:hypothetical protein